MLLAAPLAFSLSLACLLLLLSAPVRGLALDRPNERSLHETPVPRTGGIAIMAGAAGAFALAAAEAHIALLLALALAAVSFIDDLFGLPTLLRLALHLAAAAAALLLMFSQIEPVLFFPLLLGIGWLTNLYNFMDGSDGLAGGMAVSGFGVYALAAHTGGDSSLAILCAALAVAALAFLLFNFHPARIFMGDAGAIPLGFLAAVLGLAGWRDGLWPLWFPLLVFSPFVVDASLTLAKRLARGEKVWLAHREHYYQRLVRMGCGHRGTALAEYALMAACAGAAYATRSAAPAAQALLIAAAVAGYLALAVWIDARWSRHQARGCVE